LRLEPAVGNWECARIGAEWVSGKIAEVLEEWDLDVGQRDSGYDSEEIRKQAVDMRRLGLRVNNQFDLLALGETERSYSWDE
jgi:hypothetical protein